MGPAVTRILPFFATLFGGRAIRHLEKGREKRIRLS
jgi:hypothetical protein